MEADGLRNKSGLNLRLQPDSMRNWGTRCLPPTLQSAKETDEKRVTECNHDERRRTVSGGGLYQEDRIRRRIVSGGHERRSLRWDLQAKEQHGMAHVWSEAGSACHRRGSRRGQSRGCGEQESPRRRGQSLQFSVATNVATV